MITEDHIAAATIAQIFGGELLKVQENARTDSGNTPHVVKMHPRDFLASANVPNKSQQDRLQQQRLMQALQREAEAACPLPEPSYNPPQQPTQQQASPPPIQQTQNSTNLQPIFQQTNSGNAVERIAVALEKIAARLELIDLSITKRKKKKVRRSETNI